MRIIYTRSIMLVLAFLWLGIADVYSQNQRVTGRILSAEDNQGLPGVTVTVKGTAGGTATNVSGEYAIDVPAGGSLIFSSIGFVTEEVLVGNQSVINLTMVPDIQQLSEVVVIGYGAQRREDLTGAVETITEREFIQGNVVSPEQLIVGKVPGLQVTPSGAPGGGSRIRIRGAASIGATNNPLIVVDGVPLDNVEDVAGQANPLAFINPNDIESFSVLKDASATAIYGNRASNGVIIITTKKGVKGQPTRFNFSSLASLSTTPRRLDVLSGDEFRQIVGENATASQQALLGEQNTDWQSLIYQNAISHDHNLSISGSVGNFPYRISTGYINQDGVLRTSNFQRGSVAVNVSPRFFNDNLKVDINWRGSRTASRFANEGAIGSAVAFDPTQPVFMDDQRFGGYFEWTNQDGTPNTLAPRNPLSLLEQTDNRGWVNRGLGNIQIDYKLPFFPKVRANLNLGYEGSMTQGRTITPPTAATAFILGGTTTPYMQSRTNRLADFYVQYNENLEAIRSRFDVQLGYSYQFFQFDNPAFPTQTGTVELRPPLPTRPENVLLAFFGRVNYAFMDRYLFTATVRRDGTSRFGPDYRWGTFPSVAFAWRVDQEEFMRDANIFSDLKLRVSYGTTGQQAIGPYFPYLPVYQPSDERAQYLIGGQPISTLRPNGYDAGIKWEEMDAFNVGLDFGFGRGRVSGSVDYFDRNTRDILLEIDVAAGSNLTNRLNTNVGTLRSRGVEAALNFAIISNERMHWDFGVNATYLDARIGRITAVASDTATGILTGGIGGGVGNQVQIHTTGYRPFTFFTYQQVYDANGRPVEGLFVDQNGDGVINDLDLQRQYNPEPRVFMGFNSQFSYNRFSAGFTMRANLGNYMYNNVAANTSAFQSFGFDNYLTNVTPAIYGTGFNNYQYFSNYYIENASFLRMENLNFGYDVGNIFNERAMLRLNANVINLFTITRYTGLDPEVAGGIDNNIYPRPRIFSIGLNLGF